MDRFFYVCAALLLGLALLKMPAQQPPEAQSAFFSLLFPQLMNFFATPGEAQAGEAVFL